jgi:hypothetical protein
MPNTFTFYVTAYIAVGILYAAYVGSLIVRARRRVPGVERRVP